MQVRKHDTGIESDNAFLNRVEALISEIIAQNNISYYRIDASMERRLLGSGEYGIAPVIKVTTYSDNVIDQIGGLLRREFDIAEIKAAGNNADLPSGFSSHSLYYAAALKANRQDLAEYKKWGVKRLEIKVISMLQDAWIGIEKDLGIGGAAIPETVKRDIYRVGAFLEMAEVELSKIRKELGQGTPSVPQPQPQSEVIQPAAPAAEAVPAPVEEHVAAMPVSTPEITTGAETTTGLESIDMNIDSFDSMAMNVANIENKNDLSAEHLSDVVNIIPHGTADEEETEPAKPATPDAPVALNIDTVQNFNMNVNGMIERTTEIIREVGPGAAMAGIEAGAEKEKRADEPVDENAQMTDSSLRQFVQSSKLVKEVDAAIAEKAGARLNDEIDIEGDVERLRFLKVFSVKQLQERILDHTSEIVAFAEKWIGKDNGGTFDSGICLFYLEYLLVGKRNDPAFAVEYVLKFISDNDYSARYIIPTYNAIRNNPEPSNFSHLTLK